MICTKTPIATTLGSGPIRCGTLLAIGALFSSAGATDEASFLGGTLEWANPAGWSTPNVPGVGQRAIINTGTLNVTGTNELGFLTLSGTGLLTGTGTLTLVGTGNTSEWIGGAGLTNLTLQIASGSQLNISGTGNRNLNGTTLTGDGTLNWTGGLLRTGNDALIAVGTFIDTTTDGTINTFFGGTLSTLRVDSGHSYMRDGIGISTINVRLENHGFMDLIAGNLLLQGGSFFSDDGTVRLAPATELRLGAGNAHEVNLHGFSGDGTLVLAVATTTLTGRADVRVVLNAGSVGGDFVVGQEMVIAGGNVLAGATTIAADGVLRFQSTSQLDFGGRLFTNQTGGTIRWQSGDLATSYEGGITNQGYFEITHDGQPNLFHHGGEAAFINSGILHKHTGTGIARLHLPFTNTGIIIVDHGSLLLLASTHFGFSEEGATVDLAAGADLRLGSGIHQIPEAGIFSGAGVIQVVSGATVQAHGTLHTDLMLLGTGTLAGNLVITGDNTFSVYGGHLAAGGSTTLSGSNQVYLAPPTNLDFGDHNLHFGPNTTVHWMSGNLRTGGGATLTNAGDFRIEHDGTVSDQAMSGTGTLINSGTFAKTAGTGTTTVNLPVTNTGDIVAESGELRFQQAVTFPSGRLVLAGGHLRFDPTLTAGAATTLTGDGTLIGNIHAHGVINPEAHLTVDGDLTLLTTSQLLFALNATDGLTSTRLTVTGTLLLGGSLNFDFVSSDRPGPTDFVVLATGTTLAGSLANVSSGGRLFLSDGIGSFEVHYGSGSAFGANNLALANFDFTPIPEPTTALLLGLGLGYLLVRRPRREATR